MQNPGLAIVREESFEIVHDLFFHALLANFKAGLVAPQQVSLHPVRTRTLEFAIAIVAEIIDARVFEKSTDD